jgi:SLT domain-containing protein
MNQRTMVIEGGWKRKKRETEILADMLRKSNKLQKEKNAKGLKIPEKVAKTTNQFKRNKEIEKIIEEVADAQDSQQFSPESTEPSMQR